MISFFPSDEEPQFYKLMEQVREQHQGLLSFSFEERLSRSL
jgi:hypothetical protein